MLNLRLSPDEYQRAKGIFQESESVPDKKFDVASFNFPPQIPKRSWRRLGRREEIEPPRDIAAELRAGFRDELEKTLNGAAEIFLAHGYLEEIVRTKREEVLSLFDRQAINFLPQHAEVNAIQGELTVEYDDTQNMRTEMAFFGYAKLIERLEVARRICLRDLQGDIRILEEEILRQTKIHDEARKDHEMVSRKISDGIWGPMEKNYARIADERKKAANAKTEIGLCENSIVKKQAALEELQRLNLESRLAAIRESPDGDLVFFLQRYVNDVADALQKHGTATQADAKSLNFVLDDFLKIPATFQKKAVPEKKSRVSSFHPSAIQLSVGAAVIACLSAGAIGISTKNERERALGNYFRTHALETKVDVVTENGGLMLKISPIQYPPGYPNIPDAKYFVNYKFPKSSHPQFLGDGSVLIPYSEAQDVFQPGAIELDMQVEHSWLGIPIESHFQNNSILVNPHYTDAALRATGLTSQEMHKRTLRKLDAKSAKDYALREVGDVLHKEPLVARIELIEKDGKTKFRAVLQPHKKLYDLEIVNTLNVGIQRNNLYFQLAGDNSPLSLQEAHAYVGQEYIPGRLLYFLGYPSIVNFVANVGKYEVLGVFPAGEPIVRFEFSPEVEEFIRQHPETSPDGDIGKSIAESLERSPLKVKLDVDPKNPKAIRSTVLPPDDFFNIPGILHLATYFSDTFNGGENLEKAIEKAEKTFETGSMLYDKISLERVIDTPNFFKKVMTNILESNVVVFYYEKPGNQEVKIHYTTYQLEVSPEAQALLDAVE